MDSRHHSQASYSEDVQIGPNQRIRIRPVRVDDKTYFVKGFQALGTESRHRRCLTAKTGLSERDLEFLTEFDGHRHYALGCVTLDARGHESEGIAGARFVCLPEQPTEAEMAITVVDGWQQRGIGRLLLERLIAAAVRRGVERFRCYILSENTEMRRLIGRVAGDYRCKADGSLLALEFPLPSPGPTSESRTEPADSPVVAMPKASIANPWQIAVGLLAAPAAWGWIAPTLFWSGALEAPTPPPQGRDH